MSETRPGKGRKAWDRAFREERRRHQLPRGAARAEPKEGSASVGRRPLIVGTMSETRSCLILRSLRSLRADRAC
jgi:hypothetical protein